MGTALSAFEILTLAVTIERDSVDFYRKASRRYDDEHLCETFRFLANWEHKHEELFAKMKKDLTRSRDQSRTFDVFSFTSSNPQVLASMAASVTRSASLKDPSGKKSKQEILDMALERESIIIRFYTDLMKVVRDSTSKKTVEDVIKEEKRHVAILKRSLELLNNPDSRDCIE